MKHQKRVGMSCKNTRFIKRGLTRAEKQVVKKTMAEVKATWASLLERNQWKPVA